MHCIHPKINFKSSLIAVNPTVTIWRHTDSSFLCFWVKWRSWLYMYVYIYMYIYLLSLSSLNDINKYHLFDLQYFSWIPNTWDIWITRVSVSKPSQHWFMYRLVPYTAPIHYLNQTVVANWMMMNYLLLNITRYLKLFIQENRPENVVCEMVTIISQPQS